MPELRIGVSSCLLGREVRYDGGHKKDRFLTDVLGKHVRWVPVCPELELGLGVPREAIRLEGAEDAPRLVGTRSRTDLFRETCEPGSPPFKKNRGSDLFGAISGTVQVGCQHYFYSEETGQ